METHSIFPLSSPFLGLVFLPTLILFGQGPFDMFFFYTFLVPVGTRQLLGCFDWIWDVLGIHWSLGYINTSWE